MHKCFVLMVMFLMLGCQSLSPDRNKIKNKYIQQSGFQVFQFDAANFNLEGWGRISNYRKLVVIYIEGDGKAWQTRYKLSKDPTPKDPIALKLAGLDKGDNVLYLARPCQYRSINDLKCRESAKYWSSHRYSDEVVAEYQLILDQIVLKYGFEQLHLVGYSGGGVIASLLAATRKDVSKLVTVAANLDHQNWARFHKVSQLTGSLNLYSYLASLAKVEQYHLWGRADQVVPSLTNDELLEQIKALNPDNVYHLIFNGYDHACCWKKDWPKILEKVEKK